MGNANLSREKLLQKIEKLEHELSHYKKINKDLAKIRKLSRFQTNLLNAVNKAIFVTKPDGRVIFWNPFAQQVYGWSSKEAIGKNIVDLIVPQVSALLDEDIRSKMQAGISWSGEFYVHNKNGTNFPIYITVTPIFNEEGETESVIGISHDISERKKSETDLLESRNKLAAIFNSSTDLQALSEIEQDGTFRMVAVNKSYLDKAIQFGVAKKESDLVGLTIKELCENVMDLSEAETVQTLQNYARVVETKEKLEYIEELTINENEYFAEISLMPIMDSSGNCQYVLYNSHDVSERKQTENALKASEEKFRSLFENINVGVALHEMIFDKNGNPSDFIFLDVNKRYEEITFLKKQDIIGKRGKEAIPNLEQKWIDIYGKVVLTGESVSFTEHSEYLDKYWDIKAYSPGKNLFAVALNDITEQRQAEFALKESEERFKSLMQQSPFVVEIYNLDGLQISVNKSYEELWGFSAELTVNKFNVLKSKEVVDTGLIKYVKRAYAGESVNVPEYNYDPRGDTEARGMGRVRWLSTRIYPLKDKSDKVQNIVIVHQDVTERKEAEERLKNSESLFRFLAENAKDMLYRMSIPDALYEYVSPASSEVFGYSPQEFYDNPMLIAKVIHPDWIDYFKNEWQKLIEGNVPPFYEYQITHKSGEERWLNQRNSLIKNEKGKTIAIEGVVTDVTERKQMEQELLKNQKRYKKAQEIGNVGNWEYDLGTTKFWGSDEARKIFGFKPKPNELSTERVENCILEREYVHQALIDLIEKDKKYDLVYDILTEDKGIRKTIHSIAELERDAWGNAIKVNGVISDITERKQAEDELIAAKEKAEESEQRLKLASHSAELGIWEWNVKENKLVWDERMFQLYGIEKSTSVNTIDLWINGLHPEDKERAIFESNEALTGGSQFNTVFRVLHPDGKVLFIKGDGLVIRDSKGQAESMIGVNRDITESKLNERKLVEAKERAEENEKELNQYLQHLENLNNSLVDVVFTVNPEDRKIRYVNKAVETVFGYSQNECIGINTTFLYSDHLEYKEFGDKLKDTLSKNKDFLKVEMQLKRKNGEIFNAEVTTSFIKEEGKIIEILSVIRDVSEKIKYQNELIKAKEKAEESDRLKSAFLANMSHEIRTPMNGILGFTNLLKEQGLTGEDQQKFIEIIEKSGHRMLSTINDIIDISKIEAGQVDVLISDINLNKQMDELFEFFVPEAKKKNIKLSVAKEISMYKANLKSDKEKLSSILTNFIKNAIKYTHAGSIEFGYSIKEINEQNELEFYVKDTGIGIPQERQKAIFSRFVQADIEDRQVYEGSGLGLTISKAYVELLGGRIWVESEEGVGSKFCFSIPYVVQEEYKEEINNQLKDAQPPVKKGLKILIVEDDEYAVTFLNIVLKKYNREILLARDGIAAVKLCKENPDIDLILMDIKIPGVNGIEATQRIREFNKEVFILAQTAYAQSGDFEKIIQAGCNDYISKPINKNRLLEIISNQF